MKRKDLITKLMNEGFSQKTLVNLSDKQLRLLADRILFEQITPPVSVNPTLNIPAADEKNVTAAKQQKKTFVTYEGDVHEQEKLGAEEKELASDKESVMKRLVHKIESKSKKGESIDDYIKLVKKLNNGKVPEHIKNLTHKKESEPVSESHQWVNKVVAKNLPSTSKGDILKLIETKLKEQEVADVKTKTLPDFLTFDEIKGAQPATKPSEPATKPAEPTTKPGTKPGTTPKTPYEPGKGPKHNPKAMGEEEPNPNYNQPA